MLFRLDPIMSEGLLRVGGKIKRSSVPRNLAHPIPRDSHVTKLIIRHYHERTHHSGTSTTWNEIRASRMWITRGKSAVQSQDKQVRQLQKAEQ